MKKLFAYILTVMFVNGFAFGQSNNSDVIQSGDNSNALVEQNGGSSNTAYLEQIGNDHNGTIKQVGSQNNAYSEVSGNNGSTYQEQNGDDNIAEFSNQSRFDHVANSVGSVQQLQTGNNNKVYLLSPWNGDAGLNWIQTQTGNYNYAKVKGVEEGSSGSTYQDGNNNFIDFYSNTKYKFSRVDIRQVGNTNSTDVSYMGAGSYTTYNLDVKQYGDANSVNGLIDATSLGNNITVEQGDEVGAVQGFGNVANFTISSSDNTINVTQHGSFNTSNVTQN